jgi:hypothetical protein
MPLVSGIRCGVGAGGFLSGVRRVGVSGAARVGGAPDDEDPDDGRVRRERPRWSGIAPDRSGGRHGDASVIAGIVVASEAREEDEGGTEKDEERTRLAGGTHGGAA